MFVSEMNIKEFRGIKKCNKPIKLSKFTVLIGKNNSGKSSILEALSLLPLPMGTAKPYYRSAMNVLGELHHDISSMIYGYSGKAILEFTIDTKKCKIAISEDGKISQSFNNKAINSKSIYNAKSDMADLLGKKVEDLEKTVFFIPNDTGFIDQLGKLDRSTKNQIIKLGAHVRAVKLINDYIDDKYTEILLFDELQARKELPGNFIYVYLKDLGDGIEKATVIILWIEALNPDLILWDDFETTAHPSLLEALLKYLSKKKSQVVLSTHSIDVLYGLTEIKPKDAAVLQLHKTKDDILHYNCLSLSELEDIIDASLDPRILLKDLEL